MRGWRGSQGYEDLCELSASSRKLLGIIPGLVVPQGGPGGDGWAGLGQLQRLPDQQRGEDGINPATGYLLQSGELTARQGSDSKQGLKSGGQNLSTLGSEENGGDQYHGAAGGVHHFHGWFQ